MADLYRRLTERRCDCASRINWVTKWPNGLTASRSWIALRASLRDRAVGGTIYSTTIRWMLGFERWSSTSNKGRLHIGALILFFQARNVSGSKLPTTIALDQCVRELHDSIERFAVRCSLHARFSENNCRVTAVKAR